MGLLMNKIKRIEKIAEHLYKAHTSKAKFENLKGVLKPRSISEAYMVQKRLNERRKNDGIGRIAGHKVALTSQAIQKLVGLTSPIAASIFSSTIYKSPTEINLKRFVHLGLEFELAFKMRDDVKQRTSCTVACISELVGSIMPAFELIEDRNANYNNLDPASLIADNAWCGGIVLGAPIKNWRKADLFSTPVRLSYNDEIIDSTTGAAMGNPFNSLIWLALFLIEQGRPLKRGDIVMSGSTLATRFPKHGDHVIYSIDNQERVEVKIC